MPNVWGKKLKLRRAEMAFELELDFFDGLMLEAEELLARLEAVIWAVLRLMGKG